MRIVLSIVSHKISIKKSLHNYYCDNDTRAELDLCVSKLKELYKSLVK